MKVIRGQDEKILTNKGQAMVILRRNEMSGWNSGIVIDYVRIATDYVTARNSIKSVARPSKERKRK